MHMSHLEKQKGSWSEGGESLKKINNNFYEQQFIPGSIR